MSAHRYRITVTPIERDGQPCRGRCTIEFDQASEHNWLRQLEALQVRDLSGDAGVALAVALQLLKSLPPQAMAAAQVQADLQALLTRLPGTHQLH